MTLESGLRQTFFVKKLHVNFRTAGRFFAWIYRKILHAMNIKPFDQFFEASDEFKLMKDLENIGAKERTWTEEQIVSALEEGEWSRNFETEVINPNEFEYSFNERYVRVDATFAGAITGEFDVSEIWNNVKEALLEMKPDADVDEDEPLYTLDEIEMAFDSPNYERLAEKFIDDSNVYDSIEIDMDGRDVGGGSLDITASATFDSDNIEIDEDQIISDIIDNLPSK